MVINFNIVINARRDLYNMKRSLTIVSILLMICVISFFTIRYSKKSFNDLLKTKESNVTKIFMRNGLNGSYVETTDKNKIKKMINLVSERYYKKSFNQNFRSGYSYYYDFYSGNKQILRITGSGNNVDINDTYYDVSKPISTKSLANWFNSLPIKAYK